MDPSAINTSTEIKLNDTELLSLMKTNALRLLDAGVTTACDLGSKGMTAIQLRDSIKKGEVAGPRLQCANAPLTVAKGHAHAMGGVCGGGVDGVRDEVRKRAAEGADLIKVMATGGFMTAGSHPSQARFTQEEMDAIADEARKLNLRVTAHAIGTEGIERVANAGFDSVEHCAWVNAEGRAVFDLAVAQKLFDNKVVVCPTVCS
jgi:imidazolonepropionase-like amidohydrolase